MISSLRKATAFMFPFQPRRSRWRALFVFFLSCFAFCSTSLSLFSTTLSQHFYKQKTLGSTIPFSPTSFSSFYSNERRGSRDHGPPGS